MCTFKVVYSIQLFPKENEGSLLIEHGNDNLFYEDESLLDNTNTVFEYTYRNEATTKFYELVKGRLSSYVGYDLFHDSPDYILPFVDSKLEEEWLKIKDGTNSQKRQFFRSIIPSYDQESYDIQLYKYDFFCQTAIGYECIHLLQRLQ